MSGTLRGFLIALVAVNLAFVHATEAASLSWLLPLYALTLGAPLMVRFQESVIYRSVWNLAVLALFALLVQHATTSAAMEYMLEDGLRLAAICQVHLLNNLGRRQRPDLLFFNSFLIALVTAFLTWDVAYSAIFLLYVPVLVIGMAVHCIAPPGAPPVDGRVLRRVIGDGLRRSAVALALTGMVFFLAPRDFERKGLLGKRFDFSRDSTAMELGFSEQVRLDREGSVTASDRIVLRAHRESGEALAVPAHFRGATFLTFDGESWQPGPTLSRDGGWTTQHRALWQRAGRTVGATLRCDLEDSEANRLFAPLTVRRLELLAPADPILASPLRDGTVQFARDGSAHDRAVSYRLQLQVDPVVLGGSTLPAETAEDRAAIQVQPGTVPAELVRRAYEVAGDLGEEAPQHQVVARIADALRSDHEYLAPGAEGAATNLEDFVAGRGGGHCEFFATALAEMLRVLHIPCRLVTGYLSEEWDESGRVLTIRRRHAHAWVEVLDPEGGWYTVDATPALAEADGRSATSLVAFLSARVRAVWDAIVSFDEKSRSAAYLWVVGLPGEVGRLGRENPFEGLLIVSALGALLVLRRRRAPREPLPVREYRRAVRAARLSQRGGETPRELLVRARATVSKPAVLKRLEAATREHERGRYGCR